MQNNDFDRAIGSLYARVAEFWKLNSDDILDGRCGYSVFGSKPVPNPPLLIVGLNPGFNELDAEGAAHIDYAPTSSKFLEDDWSDFKKALEKLFDFEGGRDLLSEAVATNLLLFKSLKLKGDHELAWSKVPKDVRRECEEFSRLEFYRVLEVLEPQRILVVGLDAADRIIENQTKKNLAPLFRQNQPSHRLVVSGSICGIPAAGICHITGSRISSGDKGRMSAWLARYFAGKP